MNIRQFRTAVAHIRRALRRVDDQASCFMPVDGQLQLIRQALTSLEDRAPKLTQAETDRLNAEWARLGGYRAPQKRRAELSDMLVSGCPLPFATELRDLQWALRNIVLCGAY